MSYAEIKRAVDESIKETVMHDEERVKTDVLTRAFDERRKFSLRMNNKKVVPNHDSLTLLVEDQVYPYAKVQDNSIVTRDMNLHSLP